MKIKYYRKSVYGSELKYCLDEGMAEIVSTITKMKTLSKIDMEAFKKLGVEFEEVLAPEEDTIKN